MKPARLLLAVTLLPGLLLLGGACSDSDTGGDSSPTSTLRLGYFPNLTHAGAIVGITQGHFEDALGDTELETSPFNAGPEAVEALFAGALDATFIGPGPAINAFAESDGEAIRIVSGATSGGAALVTTKEIASPQDLEGTSLATPQLGNTQDVALRAWLQDQGLDTDAAGGGDVEIVPQSNADTLTAFQAGEIDGAWVPEPWATRLVREGDGHVLVDEAGLWPKGRFVTTHLIVRTEYLADHPDVVESLLEGLLAANEAIEADAGAAKAAVNDHLEEVTTERLQDEVIDPAWEKLTFTVDPLAATLEQGAEHAEAVGLLDPVDLAGIYDLTILNRLLADRGDQEVKGL